MDMPVAMMLERYARPIRLAVFAAAYFLSMATGLVLSRFDRGVAVVWFAGAVLFVKLVASPRRHWPALLLVALPCGALAIALFGFGKTAALPLSLIGVVEAWGAAYGVKRLYPRFGRLLSVDEVVRFFLVAGLAPAVGAVPAGWVIHVDAGVPYGRAWLDWFAAHALGYIVFSPPLLFALRGEVDRWLRSASAVARQEAAVLLVGVTLAALATFSQNLVPMVVLPLIAMVVATLRLGRFGAMASIVILMAVGLTGTAVGLGPMSLLHASVWLRFEAVQGYFASVMLVLLPLCAEFTARQRLLERCAVAETLHKLIIDRASDVVLRVDSDGTVCFASPSVARLWGYLPEELVGRSFYAVVHPRDAPALRTSRHAILEAKDTVAAIEYRTLCKDGSELWVEGSTRALLDCHGRVSGTITVIRDISERHATPGTSARPVMTDALTGLANRHAFDRDLVRGLASGQSGCLALFDLDHFKQINDRYGHATGDRVIQLFAGVMRDSVRAGDNAVRIGGEEFAVLLFGASIADAQQICQRIVLRFAALEEHAATGGVLRATVSAGLARFAPGTSPEAVMTAADTALYHAKHRGRNRVTIAA